jgi:hypothetical protein
MFLDPKAPETRNFGDGHVQVDLPTELVEEIQRPAKASDTAEGSMAGQLIEHSFETVNSQMGKAKPYTTLAARV